MQPTRRQALFYLALLGFFSFALLITYNATKKNQSLKRSRAAEQVCVAPTENFDSLPAGMTYANWNFSTPSSSITQHVCFANDPGNQVGIFYQLYDGPIDGTGQ